MLLPTMFDMRKAAMPSCQQSAPVSSPTPAGASYLPSSPPVRWSVDVAIFFQQFPVLEEVRLALLRQADALHASRHQSDKHTKLDTRRRQLCSHFGTRPGSGLWATGSPLRLRPWALPLWPPWQYIGRRLRQSLLLPSKQLHAVGKAGGLFGLVGCVVAQAERRWW
jgi:hypothetical protein